MSKKDTKPEGILGASGWLGEGMKSSGWCFLIGRAGTEDLAFKGSISI
jgi:hypothetical protein